MEDTQGQVNEPVNGGTSEAETMDFDNIMIPKSRFDRVNQKYKEATNREKALTAEMEELEGLYKEVEKKALEITDLYEKQKARTEQLEKVIDGLVKAKLEKIPESLHDLIPENLSVDEKLAWLAKAEEKGLFNATMVGEITIGEATNPKPKASKNLERMNPFQLLSMGYGKK